MALESILTSHSWLLWSSQVASCDWVADSHGPSAAGESHSAHLWGLSGTVVHFNQDNANKASCLGPGTSSLGKHRLSLLPFRATLWVACGGGKGALAPMFEVRKWKLAAEGHITEPCPFRGTRPAPGDKLTPRQITQQAVESLGVLPARVLWSRPHPGPPRTCHQAGAGTPGA